MIQSMFTQPKQKAQEMMMRSYYAELGSAKALQPNQKDATPAAAKRVPNPHKYKPITEFRHLTDEAVKRHKKSCERGIKAHQNFREAIDDRNKLEEEETKTHAKLSDYNIKRRDREDQEQAKNAENAIHASALIPAQKARQHEVDFERNQAIYATLEVAGDYYFSKGFY